MVSSSRDEGRTWAPVVRLDDLGSARSCVKSKCVQTEIWLCESYQQCAPGLSPRLDGGAPPDPGAPPDAAPEAGTPRPEAGTFPPARRDSSGCSFTAATSTPAPGSLLALLALLGLLLLALSPRSRGERRR
jgi:MYXO-CTERM domain-containing protein